MTFILFLIFLALLDYGSGYWHGWKRGTNMRKAREQ